MAEGDLGALKAAQERPIVRFAAVRQTAMMSGNPIAEEVPNRLAIMGNRLLCPAGRMIDAACIPGNTSLKRIRVLTDIMEKAARRASVASVEAPPKPASEDTRPAEVPFEPFPGVPSFAFPAVGVVGALM